MKLLSPRVHGYLDYVVVVLFVLAPTLFGMSQVPSLICYALAAAHATMTLFTAFPLGAVDLISFRTHGGIELVLAFSLLVLPWIAGYEAETWARNFFLGGGALLFAVWAVTDYSQVSYVDERGHRHVPRSLQHV